MNLKFIKSFFLSSFWICVLSISFTTCVYGQVLRSTNAGGGLSPSIQTTKVDTVDQKITSIDSKVKYTAEDSIRFDRAKNIVYLY